MALERVSTILRMAQEANTAAMSFMCLDYNMAYSVVTVAEELQIPVILMMLPEHSQENNVIQIEAFTAMVRELAAKVKVPIGLHMDHCSDYEYMIRAIRGGFQSVMIDGSMYSLEENIAITKKVVETAHILGADVEAELGQVGMASEQAGNKRELYTKPEAAARFCEETGVDSLTVAIGSAHGVYLETPKLDMKRLEEIRAATDTPLVLHGGSGIPHEQLVTAFRKGICKFNVGTEFMDCYYEVMEAFVKELQGEDKSLRILDFPKYAQEKLMDYL